MIDKKAIFIIPGFNHLPTNKAYRKISAMLESQGYQPIPVTIPWKKSTISENTEYFLREFRKINAKKKYILGFSFGAMIAFIASTKIAVHGLILCSLSPYFKEDLPEINTRSVSSIQLQRYRDFSKLHCSSLSKRIKAKQILIVYGSEEEKSLINRAKKAYGQISSSNKYLFSVYQAEHNIGDKKYLDKIQQITRVLN